MQDHQQVEYRRPDVGGNFALGDAVLKGSLSDLTKCHGQETKLKIQRYQRISLSQAPKVMDVLLRQ